MCLVILLIHYLEALLWIEHPKQLKQLCRIHKIPFLALLEPKVNMNKLENFKLKWVLEGSRSNNNGKIWILWRFNLVVYDKCNIYERNSLWDSIQLLSEMHTNILILIEGDFNIVCNAKEKVGANDFQTCIQNSSLQHMGYTGSRFT